MSKIISLKIPEEQKTQQPYISRQAFSQLPGNPCRTTIHKYEEHLWATGLPDFMNASVGETGFPEKGLPFDAYQQWVMEKFARLMRETRSSSQAIAHVKNNIKQWSRATYEKEQHQDLYSPPNRPRDTFA